LPELFFVEAAHNGSAITFNTHNNATRGVTRFMRQKIAGRGALGSPQMSLSAPLEHRQKVGPASAGPVRASFGNDLNE
jgi:hypothetical protein